MTSGSRPKGRRASAAQLMSFIPPRTQSQLPTTSSTHESTLLPACLPRRSGQDVLQAGRGAIGW